jgi:hypothetical protein
MVTSRTLGIAWVALFCASGCDSPLDLPHAAPVADAGFDQILRLGDDGERRIELDGRASCDPLGEPLDDARWTLVGGPGASDPRLLEGDLVASFLAGAPGEYVFELSVAAGERTSELDTVVVTVVDDDGDDDVLALPATNACGERI